MSDDAIDYKVLLKKYMNYIFEQEGATYSEFLDIDGKERGFTVREIKEIQSMATRIENE